MFTKKDYKEYFEQVLKLESKMLRQALSVKKEFKSDPEALSLIKKWENDEREHLNLAEKMLDLI